MAKTEVTYGTDPVPTGAANTIRCSNITVTPIAGSTVDRRIIYPNFGAVPKALVNKHVTVDFDVELQGCGTAGTAPAFGPLLKACGLSETVVAVTSVAYQPDELRLRLVTVYANEGGTLHELLGARGTVGFDFQPNDLPVMKFAFTGLWTAPAAVALETPTFTPFVDAIDMNKANTAFTIGGVTPVLEKCTFNLGWTVTHRDRPNAGDRAAHRPQRRGQHAVRGRGPRHAWTSSPTAYNQTAGDWTWCTAPSREKSAPSTAPKVQLLQPAYADVSGIRTLTANLALARNAGDDELVIAFT